jgi:hypothetical protein
MNCFVHREQSAIALCRHCCKAACDACAIDTGEGIACSEHCASHVRQLAKLMRSASAVSSVNRGAVAGYFWPAFLVVLGAAFAGHSLVFAKAPAATSFGLMAGSLFAGFGFVLGVFQHRLRARASADVDT